MRHALSCKVRKIETRARRIRQRRNQRAKKRNPEPKRIVRKTSETQTRRKRRLESDCGICRQRKTHEVKPRRKTKIHTQSLRRLYARKTSRRRKTRKRPTSLTTSVFTTKKIRLLNNNRCLLYRFEYINSIFFANSIAWFHEIAFQQKSNESHRKIVTVSLCVLISTILEIDKETRFPFDFFLP